MWERCLTVTKSDENAADRDSAKQQGKGGGKGGCKRGADVSFVLSSDQE